MALRCAYSDGVRTLGGGTGGVNVWEGGCTPVSTVSCLTVSCWGVDDDDEVESRCVDGRESDSKDGGGLAGEIGGIGSVV